VTLNLTTKDLAVRWGLSEKSLANARLRQDHAHPGHLKFAGRILYPLDQVEEFEAAHFVAAR